ncbi:MAG: MCE family protein [Candidatus Gastranaerophilales bacterium]|nr:MCE family protein [Candidatus Gastranaerophilales bacterium]
MKKRWIWIIELFLWAFVLFAVSFSFVFVKAVNAQRGNSYYVFFKDVDGLEKGSPVRLMGMQIGYVKNIKVFDDKVFISFLVTKNGVKVPEHAIATVEFYGLGGSKSLEMMPSTEKFAGKEDYIISKEPYRIKDYYEGSSQIAKSIMELSRGTSGITEASIDRTRELLKFSSVLEKINFGVKFAEGVENKFIETNDNTDNIKIEGDLDGDGKD